MTEPAPDGNRWRARPVIAVAVMVAVFAIPVACSIGAAAVLGHVWAPAVTGGGAVVRWLVILSTSTVVFFGCERLTRRALPLTVLLKMGMVFPGRAPRRLSVARRSWTTRDLSRRIDEARSHGITDEPTAAAEQIVALAATLSAHDRKTRGHAERVRAFTDLIAEELRLPDHDRDRLRWSALLHDVGKLTVHSDVLNKAGALSDDEWEMMRRHPLEGAKLTAPLAGWLGPWANTIAEHHERFDGHGYPYGLAGQEISMGGRIAAVADSYDTMTSLRSYKKPMSAEAARTELAACAGAQFDPVMVRAFLGVSVRRLHAVAPLTWIGSLPFGNLGSQLARIAAVGGRVGVTGVAATVGVVGLAAGTEAAGSPHTAQLSAVHGRVAGSSGVTTPAASRGGTGGATGGSGSARSGGDGSSSSGTHGSGNRASGDKTGTKQTGTGDGGGSSGSGQSSGAQSGGGHSGDGNSGTATGSEDGNGSGGDSGSGNGSGGGGSGPSTTVASDPTSSIPTTTVGTVPAATTTTTTTTAPLPPLIAPSGLKAKASCQLGIVGPEVTLTWTASPTTRVTGYVILRLNGKTYSSVATVPQTSTTYTDTSVSGLGTTYTYEVEAVAGSASATSGPASATTPTLCLL